ncbi:TerD family protein [Streptomyces kanasensis]
MIFGEVYRYYGEWKFRAVGKGTRRDYEESP